MAADRPSWTNNEEIGQFFTYDEKNHASYFQALYVIIMVNIFWRNLAKRMYIRFLVYSDKYL